MSNEPVDGFYEWKAIKGQRAKQPYAIAMYGAKLGTNNTIFADQMRPTDNEERNVGSE